ncbi:segregation/condensation protein A [Deinococcus sp. KNUC1210]|uniref:segregation/condensation protein A n=1 Tax=Deinococcus sp. KNUC1210 TaxID=2917691 RepID=UPI001EF0F828|nr:segregation/condensation protein A [Deinococcus sp. KNUC1210]ULH16151.1 segregation/condensation protein A [Deinococcus sp. KNUC1210]
MLPSPDAKDWVFRVDVPGYTGDLTGLAARLRSGATQPETVPLLRLTRELLAWAGQFAQAHPQAHAELLPALAGVIALKAKLLLPQPEPEALSDDWPEDWDAESGGEHAVLAGVQALAELEDLVRLLSQRRREREGMIPAARLDLGLPRRAGRAAGKQGLARLVRAAQNAVRDVSGPLVTRERLTLQDALKALRAYAGRLRVFRFLAVPAADWSERTTYFAALLEGVKDGTFDASQQEQFGEIVIGALTPPPE